MSGYEITFSITAVCPCCGDDLPSSAYLTVSKVSEGPFDRDNPYERKDRRVFISPCTKCYEPKRAHGPELMKMLDRHGAGDADRSAELTTAWMAGAERGRERAAEAWLPIESAPTQGIIELAVVDKTGADRRTMAAERSFRDGEPYWMVTHGWVGWTTLHTGWTPYAWRPLPASPTEEAARAGESG